MKAMIFAAGVGSRLQQLTRENPKCLMHAGGKPLLYHVLMQLKTVGVREVMINLHHYPEKVMSYLNSLHDLEMQVSFSHEPSLLDTGGGLKKIRSFFDGESSFILHNADIYSTVDLSELVTAHRQYAAIAVLAVMQRESKRGLFFDSSSHLVGWTGESSPPPSSATCMKLAFAGISVASSELFEHMGSEDAFSVIQPFLNAARMTHRVFGYRVDGAYWADIGTSESLLALQKHLEATDA